MSTPTDYLYEIGDFVRLHLKGSFIDVQIIERLKRRGSNCYRLNWRPYFHGSLNEVRVAESALEPSPVLLKTA